MNPEAALGVKFEAGTADNTRGTSLAHGHSDMSLDIYDNPDAQPADARPYIGILFECCRVYARIYRQPDGKMYEGRCPKCLRTVRVRVGKDGTTSRLFRAQ